MANWILVDTIWPDGRRSSSSTADNYPADNVEAELAYCQASGGHMVVLCIALYQTSVFNETTRINKLFERLHMLKAEGR